MTFNLFSGLVSSTPLENSRGTELRGLYGLLFAGLIFFFASIFSPRHASAQNEANNWIFSHYRALNFADSIPVVLPNKTMETNEGCSAISDFNGNLLFYTDGMVVWDRRERRMMKGQDLMGDYSSTTSALIVPVPGSEHLFYIFTTDWQEGENGFRYSIVDLRLNGGYGDVTAKNVLLLKQSTEKIAAVHHENGFDIWILTHEWRTNRFFAYLLKDTGLVTTPVISSVGSKHDGDHYNKIGFMKTSCDGKKLAVALAYYAAFVELFDFDPSSGIVSNPIHLRFPLKTNHYGIEFSLDQSKLYISSGADTPPADTSYLIQVDISSWKMGNILNSMNIVSYLPRSSSINLYGALQLAPNGKIYHTISRAREVGVINHPDRHGAGCGYEPADFGFQDISSSNLPSFVQSFFNPLRFTHRSSCFGTVTEFRASRMRSNDSVRWDFNDPLSGEANAAEGDYVVHTFSQPGEYAVRAYLQKGSRIDTASQLVKIYPNPEANAGPDQVVCGGASTVIGSPAKGGKPPYRYMWTPWEGLDSRLVAAPVAKPDSTTTYVVVVSDAQGCESTDSVTVVVLTKLGVKAASGKSVCPGDTARLGASAVGGTSPFSYKWSPSSTLDDSSSASPIAKPAATTVYRVIATDAAGCSAVDSVKIVVHEPPLVSAAHVPELCPGDSVRLEIEANGGTEPFSYEWSPAHGLSSTDARNPVAGPDTTTLYSLKLTDGNGCSMTFSVLVPVKKPPAPVANGPTSFCEGGSVVVDAGEGYASYEWKDQNDAIIGSERIITLRKGGAYAATVLDSAGCRMSASVEIKTHPNPIPVILAPSSICEGDTAWFETEEEYTSYEWRDENSSIIGTARRTIPPGEGAYSVAVIDTNGCSGVSLLHPFVVYPRPLKPAIARNGNLLISSSANHYQWFRNDTLIAGATDREFHASKSGSYVVLITDENGCANKSDPLILTDKTRTAAAISLPVLEAAPGERIVIPIELRSSRNLDQISLTGFTATLRYNKNLLYPIENTPVGIIDADSRVITIQHQGSDVQNPLTSLVFKAMLGAVESTPLQLEAFDFTGGKVDVTVIDGEFRLIICREGGARLFDAEGRISLSQNRPNPFNALTVIEYEVIEKGATQLFIMDMLGRRVATLVDGNVEPGKYRVTFDAASLSTGMYLYALQTPTQTLAKLMMVVK